MKYKGLHPNSINEVSQSVVGIYAGGEQIALFSTGSTVFNNSVTGSTFSGSFYGDGGNLTNISASTAISSSYALTASYALNTETVTFPYTGTAVITGSLVVTNHVSASLFSGSFYGDGSNLTGLTQGNKIFTQTVPASTWSFVHAAGANYPVVTIYNDSDEVVVPTRILNVDSDTLQVEFGSPVAGYAVISFGDRISGSTVKQDFTTPAVSWSFIHNLGSQFVQVQVFDDNDQQIIPSSLTLSNISSSIITFASASTGYALATIGGEPITGLFAQASASFASRITDLETFSSSLDATFATDAELAAVSSSIVSGVSSSYLLKTTDTFNGDLTVTGSLGVTGSTSITGSLSVNNYTFPLTDGTVNQIMFTDGAGNITFDFLRDVYVEVKNVSLATLPKGTPVHVSGSTGNINLVIPASASDATTMPATFVLNEQLDPDQEGLGIAVGFINGVNTSGFSEGDVVYVGENGGYTNIKPTGSNLIQNLGIVTKVDATNGSGYVLGAGRTNAVPNLLNGEVFFGEGNTAVQKSLATILSSSFYNYSGSFTGSLLGTASTASYVSFAGVDGLTSFSSSVSTRVTDLETASGSFSTRVTANEAGIASLTAATSSYLLNTTDTLDGDLTVTGKITAQEFHTEFVSASIIYQSGSTKFGDTFDDIHSFTGSVSITGSGTFSNYGPAYFMQGNVGIGTTSPFGATANRTVLSVNGTTDVSLNVGSGGTERAYLYGEATFAELGTIGSLPLRFATNNLERMRIDSSGNVGIGETSPDTKLHIKSATYDDFIKLERDGIGAMGISATNPRGIQTTDGAGNFLGWHVNSSGNVGIGTTSPNARIHSVNDNFTTSQGFLFEGYKSTYGATSPVVYIKGNWEYNTSRSTDPILKVAAYNDPNGFYVLHNGNVGIGATNPGYTLDVAGIIRGYGNIKINSGATDSPYLAFYQNSSEKAYIQYEDSGDLFALQSDGGIRFLTGGANERMRIDSSGNVTINNGLVVNEDGANADFRVEGDTDSHLIFADASADVVGIGTSSVDAKFEIASGNTSPALKVNTRLTEFLVFKTGLDTTARVDIDFTSFNVAWNQALVVIDLAGGDGNIGVAQSASVKYNLVSLTTLQDITLVTSDLHNITVSATSSGMQLQVTFTGTYNFGYVSANVRVINTINAAKVTSVDIV